MKRIGIPRALLYYQYFPMWKTFFEYLGGEVAVSPPTTRAILASGSSRVVADTCLPVKVYCGHVIDLADKCDYMLIPAIRSIEERVYNCSKFLGLPDVVKAVVPECPPILDIDIDVNKGKRALYAAIYSLGRCLTWNPMKVKEASNAALHMHLAYQNLMCTKGLTCLEALAEMSLLNEEIPAKDRANGGNGSYQATIALIGHPYIIYDYYVNHRLIEKLRSMKVRVLTPEMATREQLNRGVVKLVGRPYWTYEDEVVGAGGHYMDNNVDGIIGVVPFSCGPDSVMIDVVQRYTRRGERKPFMLLTIDEHTAEAGMVTRLEAFLDMLHRRKRLKARAE